MVRMYKFLKKYYVTYIIRSKFPFAAAWLRKSRNNLSKYFLKSIRVDLISSSDLNYFIKVSQNLSYD